MHSRTLHAALIIINAVNMALCSVMWGYSPLFRIGFIFSCMAATAAVISYVTAKDQSK